jgi:hypothetical protein
VDHSPYKAPRADFSMEHQSPGSARKAVLWGLAYTLAFPTCVLIFMAICIGLMNWQRHDVSSSLQGAAAISWLVLALLSAVIAGYACARRCPGREFRLALLVSALTMVVESLAMIAAGRFSAIYAIVALNLITVMPGAFVGFWKNAGLRDADDSRAA